MQTVLGPVHTLQLLKVSPGVPDVDERGSRRWKRVRGFSFSLNGDGVLKAWFSYTHALKMAHLTALANVFDLFFNVST